MQQAARAAVNDTPAGSDVALLTFDRDADVVLEATADRDAARSRIDTLTAGSGATSYAAALMSARDLIDERTGEIVIVTDLQRSGRDDGRELATPSDVPLRVSAVPGSTANLAVTAVERTSDRLVAVVENFGPRPRRARVTLSVDGRDRASSDVDVGGGGRAEASLGGALSAKGTARVHVDDGQGPAADDDRYLVLDPAPPVPVLVVVEADPDPRSALFVTRALESADAAWSFAITERRANDRALEDAATYKSARAVIVLGTRGLDRRAREAITTFVKGGGGLVVAAGPAVEAGATRDLLSEIGGLEVAGEDVGGSAGSTLAPVDLRHPILAALGPFASNLAQVRIDRAVRITVPPSAQVVARLTDSRPAFVEATLGSGRVILFASDLGRQWNELPLHPTFVPLMQEVVRYVGRLDRPVTDVLVEDAPAGVPRTPGIVDVGTPPVKLAVNVDPRESAIESMSPEELLNAVVRTPRVSADLTTRAERHREAEQSWWRYALMGVLALLVVESVVSAGRRRKARADVTRLAA